jgi:HlyD family secretion protein
VQEAYADLTLARTNRKLSRIVSPIDGVVLDRQVEVGQTVAAQFQVATLFTLAADLTQVEVLVAIDEADMGRVVPPMPIHFAADAHRGRTFEGTLRAVRPAPVGFTGVSEGPTQATVVTYLGHIDAANDDHALWEGMTVQVDFVTASHRNVVRVPTAALRYHPIDGGAEPADGPREGQTLYTVGADNKPVAHAVTVGLSDGRYTEITDGFTEGQVIVRQRGGAAASANARRGK